MSIRSDDAPLYAHRQTKYSRVVHAEMNALHLCHDQSKEGYTLYTWPLPPCDRCAVHIIQSGINRVVSVAPSPEIHARWGDSLLKSGEYFDEVGLPAVLYDASGVIQVGENLVSPN